MNVNLLMFIIVVVMAIGFAATLWVGFSRENRDGDPEYEQQTGRKLTRLILMYAFTITVVIVAFFLLL